MANDNPFISFFSSMAAGAEAGRERKTLLQRAQKGQVSQAEVPSMAATILQGIGRATMTPNERANQDQIKMQMASMALAQSNREKVQKLNELKFLADQAEEAKLLESEINDSLGFRTESARAQNLLTSRDYKGLRSFTPDPSLGLSQKTTADLYAFRDNLFDSEMGKRLVEMDGMVEALRRRFPPEQIPTTYEAQKELLARVASMETAANVAAAAKVAPGEVKSVTVNLGGGNQFTYSPPTSEESEGYSKKELADRLIETNTAISRAQGSDLVDPAALNTLTDTFDMLSGIATKKGYTDIIPGYRPPEPPAESRVDLQGFDSYQRFLDFEKQHNVRTF